MQQSSTVTRYLIFFQYIGTKYRSDSLYSRLRQMYKCDRSHINVRLWLQWGDEGSSTPTSAGSAESFRGQCQFTIIIIIIITATILLMHIQKEKYIKQRRTNM